MGAWRVRETADLPPIPRARPVTQGVVACERLRPRPFLARDHPIFSDQKSGIEQVATSYRAEREMAARWCAERKEKPDGRG